ncbi:MAG: DNA-directed RNA polymerase subunit alpha [Candidatus Pacebacteria bacterium]|nr:DNA-directed RNA polymerase subunit alpha [Candidatus Paceibacterota bacterium]
MPELDIALPSKPKIVFEEEFKASFEIDGLAPGYGHTLGNSLRRIILASLPGAAITSVKINGVSHEFSVIDGVKEDVITILLNLKKLSIQMITEESQTLTLKAAGVKNVTAADIDLPGQVKILNPEMPIATLTDKGANLEIDITVERGLGFVQKEVLQKDKVEIGTLALDAIFTPIRRVNYEVQNMRVGDRTDFNKLTIYIETNGTITPKEALEKSIEIMINQLKAIIGFREEVVEKEDEVVKDDSEEGVTDDKEFLKTRIESLDLSARTQNALTNANIRTVGGLLRKKEDDLLEVDGLGEKGIQEIKKAISNFGVTLK